MKIETLKIQITPAHDFHSISFSFDGKDHFGGGRAGKEFRDIMTELSHLVLIYLDRQEQDNGDKR